MQKLMGLIRRCVDDYNMIAPGDRIAVGVSGGKDSLTLLAGLAGLRRYHPSGFSLEAITLDMGYDLDYSGVARFCDELDVPFTVIKTQIAPLIFDIRKESNPCSMCAKLRRGALNDAALARGIKKIALGHHFDDAVETFMLSMVYEGRLSCFQPVTYLDRSGITQIRPMLYVGEQSIKNFAAREKLPVVFNPCPADKHTKREEMKELIFTLNGKYPGFKNRLFGGMQRLPLPEWGVADLKRRPLPDEDD